MFNLLSIHRRGGKDLTHLSMAVLDAVTRGGVHYYVFPTKEWAGRAMWDERPTINGVTKRFIEHLIPTGIKYVMKEKDKRVYFPESDGIVQFAGSDGLDFVGQGGASYTLSEFSLHKAQVTGFIMPILRQANAPLRMNGTIRGRDNQLWKMLEANKDNPKWFTQWLRPHQTKCYCWVGSDQNINPELLDHIGERGPNGTPIFNVQDDIDSLVISYAEALQEYINEPILSSDKGYYGNEFRVARGEGRIDSKDVKYDRNLPVFTFWDLGKGNSYKNTDSMVIWYVQFPDEDYPQPKKWNIIGRHESTGKDWAFYAQELNRTGYWFGNHFAPWDIVKGQAGHGVKINLDYALERGIRFEKVRRSGRINEAIEVCRRCFGRCHFSDDPEVSRGAEYLASYHQKTDRNGVGIGSPDHDMSSNTADAYRTIVRAWELEMIYPVANNDGFGRFEKDEGTGFDDFYR